MTWPEHENGRQDIPPAASKDFGTQTETTHTHRTLTSKSELLPALPRITSTAPGSYVEIGVVPGQSDCRGCCARLHVDRPQAEHADLGLIPAESAGGDR